MADPLFREEVFEYRQTAPKGELIVAQPLAHWLLTTLLVGIIAAAIVYLSLGSYNRREAVRGFLIPDRGIVKVMPPHRTTIVKRHVEDGHRIEKGQPLFTLAAPRRNSGGEVSYEQVLDELNEQRNILEGSLERAEHSANVREEHLKERRIQIKRALYRMRSLLDVHQRRLELSRDSLERAKSALADAPGLISGDELRQRKDQVLESEQYIEELQLSLSTKEAELESISFESNQLALQRREKKAQLERELSELQVTRSTEEEIVVLAPISGRITALRAAIGQAVGGPSPLCMIIPENAKLEAEVYVPTRAAGWVQEGQAVRLMYDAFPHEHYGVHAARVLSVSRTILNPHEVDAPVPLQEPVYQARLELSEHSIRAFGTSHELQPGMLLTGHVQLEKRTLWRWLLRPLYALDT